MLNKEKKPIYCFTEEETGNIKVEKITDYTEKELYNHKKVYTYKKVIRFITRRYDFKESDIDRLVRNRVYSFNPDKEHAVKIILESLEKKYQKYNVMATGYKARMDNVQKCIND